MKPQNTINPYSFLMARALTLHDTKNFSDEIPYSSLLDFVLLSWFGLGSKYAADSDWLLYSQLKGIRMIIQQVIASIILNKCPESFSLTMTNCGWIRNSFVTVPLCIKVHQGGEPMFCSNGQYSSEVE